MFGLKKNSKPDSDQGKEFPQTDLMKQYQDRFEEAVMDAQYMIIHASVNQRAQIDRETIETLSKAKLRVEKHRGVNAKDDADFWLAYQGLCKLVEPATAESIKANMPLQRTLFVRMLRVIPFFRKWTDDWYISKSRKSVNRYIAFTAVTLFFLLTIQIYWVIGNQVVIELGKVSELKIQTTQSHLEYTALINQLTQSGKAKTNITEASSGTDSSALKIDLSETNQKLKDIENDLFELKAKEDRYAAILRFWSRPWNTYIRVERVIEEHTDKFASQFIDIENQIKVIDEQSANDPNGTKAVQRIDLQAKLNENDNSLSSENKKLITDYISKDQELTTLKADKSKIEELQLQISSLKETMALPEYDQESRKADITYLEDYISYATEQISELEPARQHLVAIEQLISDLDTLKSSQDPANLKSIDDKQASIDQMVAELSVLLQAYPYYTLGDTTGLEEHKQFINDEFVYWNSNRENAQEEIARLKFELDDIQKNIIDNLTNLNNQLIDLEPFTIDQRINSAKREKDELELKVTAIVAKVADKEAIRIVEERKDNKQKLQEQNYELQAKEQAYLDLIDSRPAQLAAKFLLDILQSYILPILYGILGAATSVLRSLSRKIRDVAYSEETGIQHLLSISLGTLTGIMVGWFSFLIPSESTSFLGSVSPLAIAFLVGYNIEIFFSRMDHVLENAKAAPAGPSSPQKIISLASDDTEIKQIADNKDMKN